MIHARIFREIPRIIKELDIGAPDDTKVDGFRDAIYRLCCDESLTLMGERFGVSTARVYEVITEVFTREFVNGEDHCQVASEAEG